MTHEDNIKLLIGLIREHGIGKGPSRAEFHGDWAQVVIPTSKDTAAYLFLPSDALEVIVNAGSQGQEKRTNVLSVGKIRKDLLRQGRKEKGAQAGASNLRIGLQR